MHDWSKLVDAYGPATEIPGLLSRLTPSAGDTGWTDAWGRLCHQGTVYTASYAALPLLLDIARRWTAEYRTNPLSLAAAIVASEELEGSRDELIAPYVWTIEKFSKLARESLSVPNCSSTDFRYLIGATLVFNGHLQLGERFESLKNGCVTGRCTDCSEFVCFVIGNGEYFSTTVGWHPGAITKRFAIEPITEHELHGVEKWAYDECLAGNQTKLASDFCYFLGRTNCPMCHCRIDVAECL